MFPVGAGSEDGVCLCVGAGPALCAGQEGAVGGLPPQRRPRHPRLAHPGPAPAQAQGRDRAADLRPLQVTTSDDDNDDDDNDMMMMMMMIIMMMMMMI